MVEKKPRKPRKRKLVTKDYYVRVRMTKAENDKLERIADRLQLTKTDAVNKGLELLDIYTRKRAYKTDIGVKM